MKIVLFADIHYFGDDIEKAIFNTQKKLVQYAIPITDKLVETVNGDEEIDMCVNLGDIIQDTQDKGRDLVCLDLMFRKLENINCPCYSVLGNHDLKMMDSVEEVEAVLGKKSTCSVDMDGYHLVFLTTEVRSELGLGRGGCYKAQYMAQETIDWLKEDLERNELPCVVFTHYGLAEEEPINDECMFMKNRADVKAVLKNDKNILGVFSGHQHVTKTIVEDGIPYFLLGSMTACSETAGVPTGVYMELVLKGGRLDVTERHIKVPIEKNEE